MQVPLIAALLVFWSLGQASPTDSSRSIAHHRYYDHRSTKSNKTYGLSELIHMRAPVKKKKQHWFMKLWGSGMEFVTNAGMAKQMMEDKKITSAQNAILKEKEFQLNEKKLQSCCYFAIFAIIAVVGVIALGGYIWWDNRNNPNPIFGPNRGRSVSSSSPPPPPVKLNFQQTLFQMISDQFDLLFVLFILITSTVVLLCVVRLRTLVAKRILVIGSRRIGGGGAGISRIYSQSSPSTVRSFYSNRTKKSRFSRVPTRVNCPPSNFNRVPTRVNCPPSNFNRVPTSVNCPPSNFSRLK